MTGAGPAAPSLASLVMLPTERLALARRAYRDALADARARSTPGTWRRLVRAAWNRRAAEREVGGAPSLHGRPVVLMVEDDAATRRALRDLLVARGLTVWTAEDAHVALEFLRAARTPPSVILLDLVLPGMNGGELRSRLLADHALASVPVVAMTGQAGAVVPGVPVLEKPVDPSALVETLKAAAR